jgi:hypothetical protein
MAAPNDPLGDLENHFLGVSQSLAAMRNQPAALLAPALQQQLTALQQQGATHSAALQQQGAAHSAALQQQTAALQQLTVAVQQVQQQLALSDARHQNHAQRQLNAFLLRHDDLLRPLVREQPGAGLGTLPPAEVFPATRADALELGNAGLNALATFYGEDFGHIPMLVADRRRLFAAFIGLQAC